MSLIAFTLFLYIMRLYLQPVAAADQMHILLSVPRDRAFMDRRVTTPYSTTNTIHKQHCK